MSNTKTAINGIKITFRKQDEAVIKEVFSEDSYRIGEVKEGSSVIDIGAHIGTFTLRCALEKKCFVYAYEPYLPSFSILRRNVRQNSLQQKVKAFNFALAQEHGVRSLYYRSRCSAGSTLYKPIDIPTEKVSVPCVTLADAFNENDIGEVDVLKVDSEGAEQEIFTSNFEEYIKRASYVIIEWHNYDGHKYADFLGKLGYSVLLTGCGDPQPKYDSSFGRGMLYAHKVRS